MFCLWTKTPFTKVQFCEEYFKVVPFHVTFVITFWLLTFTGVYCDVSIAIGVSLVVVMCPYASDLRYLLAASSKETSPFASLACPSTVTESM